MRCGWESKVKKKKHYFFEKNVSTTKKKENLLTNFKCDEYLVPIFLDLSVHLSVHFLRDFHFGTGKHGVGRMGRGNLAPFFPTWVWRIPGLLVESENLQVLAGCTCSVSEQLDNQVESQNSAQNGQVQEYLIQRKCCRHKVT